MTSREQKRDKHGRFAPEGKKTPLKEQKTPTILQTQEESPESPTSVPALNLYETYQQLHPQEHTIQEAEEPLEGMANTHYPYHKAFTHFPQEVLSETKRIFRSRPSQLSQEQVHNLFSNWLQKISTTYNVPTPHLYWDAAIRDETGGGMYVRWENAIYLSHISITTFLHEYRHHLQSHGVEMIHQDLEEDARAWSLSLYSAVRPKLLQRLVQEGKIFHINPADM